MLERLLVGENSSLARWVRPYTERFSFVFVVCLALTVADRLGKLQMVIDILRWTLHQVAEISSLHSALIFLGVAIHQVLEWWRAATAPVFAILEYLIRFSVPPLIRDFLSILFFSYARFRSQAKGVRLIDDEAKLKDRGYRSMLQKWRRADKRNKHKKRTPEEYEQALAEQQAELKRYKEEKKKYLKRAFIYSLWVFFILMGLQIVDVWYVSIRAG